MVWAGYTHTCARPTHLRSAPESCLVYRRTVKDLSDNHKILEDTFAILYIEKHFSRQLRAEPHKLEITLYYCDHPQNFVSELTETAMPGVGVQMNRSTKAQHDFGIRRWLPDTGCGHDLAQSSLVLSKGSFY
jgi:EAL domain-containing protein (putative c-di-GMP-specific phosphodiesterase class I)